jgi:predicted transcriptional regulator
MANNEVEIINTTTTNELTTTINTDLDQDYDYTRDNLKEVIGKGSTALDGILELAQESEHPRAYEVVGQIIKSVVDANIQLIELQKNMKALKKKDATGPKSITNALFVGSTHELQKLLKGKKLDVGDE